MTNSACRREVAVGNEIKKKKKNLPQTHLAVAGGVGVPIGHGHQHLGEPWALEDERSKAGSRHCGRWFGCARAFVVGFGDGLVVGEVACKRELWMELPGGSGRLGGSLSGGWVCD